MQNTDPKRTAIFGGSFDPPHVGHVLAVHYVLLTSDVDQILVIPCARHAFNKDSVPFEHRMAMCRLAFRELGEKVSVSDIEARREKPSYTIDTVRELKRQHPDTHFELITGSDLVNEIDQWKEADALREMIDIRVLPRLEESQKPDKDVSFYLPRISSSTIRAMIRQGDDITPHVPYSVNKYIEKHHLYQ
jgi:nicotinate-nucleotide adenylyltransferase